MRRSSYQFKAPTRVRRPNHLPYIFNTARLRSASIRVRRLARTVLCLFFHCLFLLLALRVCAQLIGRPPAAPKKLSTGWWFDHGLCSVQLVSLCVPTNTVDPQCMQLLSTCWPPLLWSVPISTIVISARPHARLHVQWLAAVERPQFLPILRSWPAQSDFG